MVSANLGLTITVMPEQRSLQIVFKDARAVEQAAEILRSLTGAAEALGESLRMPDPEIAREEVLALAEALAPNAPWQKRLLERVRSMFGVSATPELAVAELSPAQWQELLGYMRAKAAEHVSKEKAS